MGFERLRNGYFDELDDSFDKFLIKIAKEAAENVATVERMQYHLQNLRTLWENHPPPPDEEVQSADLAR